MSALPASVSGQVRSVAKQAKGGELQADPWSAVPESFQHLRNLPEWSVPDGLSPWQSAERERTRETVIRLLRRMPPRPDPRRVKVLSREERDDYIVERIEFHNGVDSIVPGLLLVPKRLRGPAPVVMGLHSHDLPVSGGKERVCTDATSPELIGPMLARNGYIVAAVDGYFSGERIGRGPAGAVEHAQYRFADGWLAQEWTLFKLHGWYGHTLWGMMLRDQQCLLDYLETRPEVDKGRIAATGMGMGGIGSAWLAAIDDRVGAVVGVGAFMRYKEVIATGNLRAHGICMFVPGLLSHFDMDAVYALIAPRPMLMLTGDRDAVAPAAGVAVLEEKLGAMYRLYGRGGNFRSVLYEGAGHEYLPEMRQEMLAWLDRHLQSR